MRVETLDRDEGHGPLLTCGRSQDEAQCAITRSPSPLLEHYPLPITHPRNIWHATQDIYRDSQRPRQTHGRPELHVLPLLRTTLELRDRMLEQPSLRRSLDLCPAPHGADAPQPGPNRLDLSR